MKKFNFRLDSFLKIKQFEEKIAWNEVLKQEGRVSIIQEQIDTTHMSIQAAREEMSRVGDHHSIHTAQLNQMSIEGLSFKLKDLQFSLKKEIALLHKLKERHFEFKKEAKSLETYKENKKNDYKQEIKKKDILRLSEVGTQKHSRRKINE